METTTQEAPKRVKNALAVMEEANRLALTERLEPKEIAVRLGISFSNLRNKAAIAGMRYHRPPGAYVLKRTDQEGEGK